MAINAKDVDQLHQYATGVMSRAYCHAGKVKGVSLTLLGGVVWKADAGSIYLRQYNGSPANMLWMSINGKDYALCYNHKTEKIEIRDRTQGGQPLYAIDDTVPVADIESIINSL